MASFAFGFIAGYEVMGNASIKPVVWQLRLMIVTVFAMIFNLLSYFLQWLTLTTWDGLEAKWKETLEIPTCIKGDECVHHGFGYDMAQYAGYCSLVAAFIMYQMTRKFRRRVQDLRQLTLHDISGEIDEGMLEKEKDCMGDDEIADMLEVGTEGVFKESHQSAAKTFACYVYKDPSEALPMDLEIEVRAASLCVCLPACRSTRHAHEAPITCSADLFVCSFRRSFFSMRGQYSSLHRRRRQRRQKATKNAVSCLGSHGRWWRHAAWWNLKCQLIRERKRR